MAKLQQQKYSLTLLDRVILPSILKQESDYKTIILNKDIKGKCSLTQEELKKFDVKPTPAGGLAWNNAGVKAKFDISFTEMEVLEVKLTLQQLDQDKKLTDEFLNLYETFVK